MYVTPKRSRGNQLYGSTTTSQALSVPEPIHANYTKATELTDAVIVVEGRELHVAKLVSATLAIVYCSVTHKCHEPNNTQLLCGND